MTSFRLHWVWTCPSLQVQPYLCFFSFYHLKSNTNIWIFSFLGSRENTTCNTENYFMCSECKNDNHTHPRCFGLYFIPRYSTGDWHKDPLAPRLLQTLTEVSKWYNDFYSCHSLVFRFTGSLELSFPFYRIALASLVWHHIATAVSSFLTWWRVIYKRIQIYIYNYPGVHVAQTTGWTHSRG